MKKSLLSFVFVAAASTAMADGWQRPVYQGAYQPLTAEDTVYIYNVQSQLFLTEGNDWGTHGTVGSTGLRCVVKQYQAENADGETEPWDGKTYTIEDYSVEKKGWKQMFINAEGLYVDRSSQEDYFFSFTSLSNNTYNIYGADINPVYNTKDENASYLLGHYTEYNDVKNGIQSGTGVVFGDTGVESDFAEGTFRTVWAFVSQSDYDAYALKVEAYEKSEQLKDLIDEAKQMGVDTSAADAVYANTSSTASQLDDAIAALNAKILAYYETSVTPDSPKDLTSMIANPACDAIDGWNNGINASTWNTQTWIGDGWTGMDGTTLNIWGSSLQGTVSQSLTGLPNGIYVVSIAVFSEKTDGAVYANENTKSVAGAAVAKVYEVTTNVTDGNLEFGFSQDEAATNWVALDNASVKYYGSGTEAYRYWLTQLLESAPSFDDAIVQTSLNEKYEGVLASVNTANTKDEILAIIPAYEAVLNEISLNIDAYAALKKAMTDAENLSENANILYSEAIVDYNQESAQPVIDEHTLSTEEVNAITEQVKKLAEEAQNYIWNIEKLENEVKNAVAIYDENNATCSPDADAAYVSFMDNYDALDRNTLTNDAIQKMLDDLYAIEFELQKTTDPASDENPVDYTAKIFNPTFVGVDGWTNNGWGTCGNNTWYGFANEEGATDGSGNYLNLWNESNASVSQSIANLPAGAYTLQFGAYADNEGLQVYVGTESIDIPVGKNDNGEYMRLYTIDFIVTDPTSLTEIGVRNTNGGTMWAMVDEMSLQYKGTESEIMTGIALQQSQPMSQPVATYSVSGVQQQSLQRGVNIVRMADGTVKKIMVK